MIPNISSVDKVRFIKNSSNRVQNLYTQQVENLKTKLDKLSEKDSIVAKNNILKIVNAIQYQLNVKGEMSNSYKNKIICEIENILPEKHVYPNCEAIELCNTFIHYAQHRHHTWFGNRRINFFGNICKTASINNMLHDIGLTSELIGNQRCNIINDGNSRNIVEPLLSRGNIEVEDNENESEKLGFIKNIDDKKLLNNNKINLLLHNTSRCEVEVVKDNENVESAQHAASVQRVIELRFQLVNFLINYPEKYVLVYDLIDAIKGKIENIPENSDFWNSSKRNDPKFTRYGEFDKEIINKIFPESTNKTEVKDLLYDNDKFQEQCMSAAFNLFVTTDKVHPYKNWIDIFCQNLGVQNLACANSHFYIEGMDPMYIPNDGNCAFHGLDYLIGQKAKSLA